MKTIQSRWIFSALLPLWLVCSWSQACELDHTTNNPTDLRQANAELSLLLVSGAQENNLVPAVGQNMVEKIDCYLGKQQQQFPIVDSFVSSLSRAGRALHQADQGIQQSMALEGLNATVNRDAGTGYVVFPNTTGGRAEVSLYNDLLAEYCHSEVSQPCRDALNLAKNLWDIAGHYRAFADNFNQSDKQQSLAFNQALDQQWRTYKDDTIKLWPQEVALNSLVYRRSDRGLSAPPNYKLLALRPSIGLSYLSDHSARIQPTINLDLLGIYWWQYTDRQRAATPGRGVSISLVWDGDDTAYGLSYHHNPRWSVSAAQGDENDLVISLSLQLAYWFVRR